MILGYKMFWPWGGFTNFAQKILKGIKKHSIRVDEKDRWRAAMKIQHAHGVRTKRYLMFHEGECKSIQKIKIIECDSTTSDYCYELIYKTNDKKIPYKNKYFKVLIDGNYQDWKTIVKLAHNDGFDSTDDFFRWFFNGFSGKIIHFTDLKY